MTLGVDLTKATLDARLGRAALNLKEGFDQFADIKAYLDALTAQNIVDTYGYTLTEANTMKSAVADAAQLAGLWNGTGTLGVAKDFRAFIKSLYGLGFE